MPHVQHYCIFIMSLMCIYEFFLRRLLDFHQNNNKVTFISRDLSFSGCDACKAYATEYVKGEIGFYILC